MKAKKAKSPTGRPSKVSKAMKDFDKGKKVAGKKASAYTKKKVAKKKSKGVVSSGGIVKGSDRKKYLDSL